jgi:hypothetical protein
MNLATVELGEDTPRLSSNELVVYFSGHVQGGDENLYVAHRSRVSDAFGPPALLGSKLNTDQQEYDPSLSPNGLALWFMRRTMVGGEGHLYVATRSSTLVEFEDASKAASVNAPTPASDGQPFVTADGNELWFTSTRGNDAGNNDVWHAPRTADGFGTAVPELALDSPSDEALPVLSTDRLTVYVTSDRPQIGRGGPFHIWRSHRTSVEDGFPAPALVDELNSTTNDYSAWLSTDGCRFYLSSDRDSHDPGSRDIFMAIRQP